MIDQLEKMHNARITQAYLMALNSPYETGPALAEAILEGEINRQKSFADAKEILEKAFRDAGRLP